MNGLYLVAICMIGVAAATQRLDEETYNSNLAQDQDFCRGLTGVTKKVYSEAEKGILNTKDRALQLYAACMMMRDGAMKSDGSFIMDELTGKMPEARAEHLTEAQKHCGNESGEDSGVKAINIYACFQRVLPYYQFV